jgi:hypothetical protein
MDLIRRFTIVLSWQSRDSSRVQNHDLQRGSMSFFNEPDKDDWLPLADIAVMSTRSFDPV